MNTTDEPSQPTVTEVDPLTYWAFISYNHHDDSDQGRQWAAWLHQSIEHYEIPSDLVGTKNSWGEIIPEQIYPVFRDVAELSSVADLSLKLQEALDDSRHLVVICSPRALKSRHVSREVAHFKKGGKTENIHAVIVDGRPNASDSDDPDDWAQECFVPPLRFAVDEDGDLTTKKTEPLAADVRVQSGEQGWTTAQAYREYLKANYPEYSFRKTERMVSDYKAKLDLALMKVVAGILGVPLRDLTARNKAHQLRKIRKRVLIAAWAAGFMALLAMAAITAGGIAVKKQFEARIAEGKALLNQAVSHQNASQYPQAQMTAAKALGFSQFEGELKPAPKWKYWADETYPRSLLPNRSKYSKFVRKLNRIASGQGSSALSPLPVWCSPPIKLPPGSNENPAWAVVFSPDYRWSASGCEDGVVRVYSWSHPEKYAKLKSPGPPHQAIRDIKISADGNWLAVAYEAPPRQPDFFVIWKIHRREDNLPTFNQHRIMKYDRIAALDWSPDSTRIVTAGGATYVKGTVAVWNRDDTTNTPIAEHEFPGRWLFDVTWSPLGNTIAMAGHKQVILVDPATAKPIDSPLREFDDDTAFTSISFNHNGNTLAAGTTARDIYFWTLSKNGTYKKSAVKNAHDYAVRDVEFASGSDDLISSSTNGIIRIWDTTKLPQLELHATLMGDSSKASEKFPAIRSLAASPDGNFIFTGLMDGTTRLWNLGRRQSWIMEDEGNVESLNVSSQKQLLAIARDLPGKNSGTVSVYDLKKERTLWKTTFPLAKREGFAMRLTTEFVLGGRRLLCFNRPTDPKVGSYLAFINSRDGNVIDITQLDQTIAPRVCAFSKSGNKIVVATKKGRCYTADFDPTSNRLPTAEDFKEIEGANEGLKQTEVWDLVVDTDGKQAALLGRHKINQTRQSFVHLLDLEKNKTSLRTDVGLNVAMCGDFHPDGKQIAIGTFDRRLIYVLNTRNGKEQGEPLRGHERGITALQYSDDGSKLASGSSLQIRIWDMESRDEITALYAHEKMVQALAWNTDNESQFTQLISGAEEEPLKFWPLRTPKLNLESYLKPRNALEDNEWLVFNEGDGTLEWNTDTSPRKGYINLPEESSLGRIYHEGEVTETPWQLYLESIQAGNWASADILYRQLTPNQRQRNSLIINQSARKSLLELKKLADLPRPPIGFLEYRASQIKQSLQKGTDLWKDSDEFLAEIRSENEEGSP